MDIFAEVKKLNFPRGQYVVVGGGVLAAHGIRDTRDIDLVVAPDLFAQCKNGGWQIKEKPNGRIGLVQGLVEMYLDVNAGDYRPNIAELIRTADVIQGIPFITLEELLLFKKAYGRPKDLVDIGLINDFLRKN